MPARRAPIITLPLFLGAVLATAGCSSPAAPPAIADTKPPAVLPLDARTQLAGLAAAAKDRRFTAGYTLTQSGRPARTVQVVLATDGSWRVDVPGGALGGQADVAIVGTLDGMFQCRLGEFCVRAAGPKGPVPATIDPRVQHPFVTWLDPLTDRTAALSVATAPLLPGARGACFSIEASSAALAAPVDPGIYCYDVDGTLTAVRTGFGALVLATPAASPPPTVTMPGPVTKGSLLSTAAPPPPPSAPASSPPPGARPSPSVSKRP